MNYTNRHSSHGMSLIRTAFLSLLIASPALSCGALGYAQEQSIEDNSPPPPSVGADGMTEAEHVMVTGSNIPTAAEVGPNPIQTIDRFTIEKSGEWTTEELLRNQSVANANGVPTSGNGGGIAFGQGGSSISLRGLDASATLVLINGHRIAPFPSGTNGADTFIDLNTIPRAAIASIEILKDGASTTYGVDAIAGVVDIKLRHDYRGAELNFEYGNTTNRDSAELAASLVFGVGNDKTSITGVVNYYSRNSIFNHDRDYHRHTPFVATDTDASPFNLEVSRAAAEAAAGRPITEIPPGVDTFFAHAPFFTNGSVAGSAYVFTENRSVTFPVFRYQTDLPDAERYGQFINADHKILGDQMVAYGDLFFQRAKVHYESAPASTFDFKTPGAAVIGNPLAIPPHTAGVIVGGPTYAEVGLPLTAYNPFNPFDQIFSGNSRGRLFEFGPRDDRTFTDSFFATAGLRGDKLFDGNWGYNATMRHSRVRSEIDIRSVSESRFQRILNAADPIFDPVSPQFIGTTVPYNPFGDYRVPIRNNYRLADFAEVHAEKVDRSTVTAVDLNIYTVQLCKLPSGPIGAAFGGQFWHETLDVRPDDDIVRGDVLGIGHYPRIKGDRDSYAGYAETSIPVFGSNFSAPGFRSLDFSAAARFEAFSNGDNVMVPKFGMRWQPIDDSLTLRATWGEGFRQPTLIELSAPPASAAIDVFDPIRNEVANQLALTFLPNPNLEPEDSRNFTAGVVYSPKFVPGLTLNIDIFNIETTGWINPYPDPTRAIEQIESGHGFPGESTTRDANGHLVQLTFVALHNTGTQKVRGADFGVDYERQTSFGTFRSKTQVSFLDSYQFSPFPGEQEEELRSSPVDFFSDDAYLKWKGMSQLGWSWRGFDAAVTGRYRDGFHEFDVFGNEHWVKQTWFFDLQASYRFTFAAAQNGVPVAGYRKDEKNLPSAETANAARPLWKSALQNTTVTLGCNNVFDHDPPRANDNFPLFIYDTTGRFVYVSITKKFW